MKRLSILFFVLSSTLLNVQASAQEWQFAKLIKSVDGGSDGTTVATDRFGNVFMGAYYWGAGVMLDSSFLPGIVDQDYMMVAKYDSSGNLKWGITTYIAGSGSPINMKCDQSGNLIILGMCGAPFTWQGYTIGDTAIHTKYFLAKVSPEGSVLWLKKVVNVNNTVAPSTPPIYGGVAVDNNGNIYVTGGLVDTVNNIEGHMFAGNGGADIFINKYDSAGTLIWTRVAGGNHDDLAWSIATTQAGNVYIAGSFSSDSLLFDSVKLFKMGGSGTGLGSVFVAKYDSSGNVIWAKSSVGAGVCAGVATDIGENAYITGMSDSIAFDSFGCVHAGSCLCLDMTFIAKFNSVGNIDWVKQIDGTGPEWSSGIAVDGCNNVWVAADITVNTSVATDFPALLEEYAPNGTLIDSATIQSGYNNKQLAIDANRNIYLACDVWPFMNNGPRYFYVGSNSYYITNGYMDGYFAKYTPTYMERDSAYAHTDTAFCSSASKSLLAPAGYIAYRWSDGSWGSVHTVIDTTSYFVYCYPATCASPTLVDTFSSSIDFLHTFSLGNDTSSCVPFYLNAPFTSGTYFWQDSTSSDSFYVTSTGMYIFTDKELSCSFADTILVTIDSTPCSDGGALMPNAFTPNDDGINDIIRPVFKQSGVVSDYSFSIYDRYGNLVFTTKDLGRGWDGKVNGKTAESGVYLYSITFMAVNGANHHNMSGNITLIR